MNDKDNTVQNTENLAHLTMPQMLIAHIPVPEEKPLDRVNLPTEKKRSRERER